MYRLCKTEIRVKLFIAILKCFQGTNPPTPASDLQGLSSNGPGIGGRWGGAMDHFLHPDVDKSIAIC
ncbi:predicted protein [Sclerotinia sclerotiorum 1980 UF-70]|uniref:Uncharacterized protein n=1 Tax=Sclerotinia sclerotiorum (strain ATCC 18683 / 1980 / Ss-1) TaxID=665079 RepID=A7ES33_SCLS1|nr:predicted protein [Sclerotinia sclerotiorum 1980 UF-70]EDN92275.1 predicted protein [Sclerotinia sclerotiorum 1980 UF-70]